MNIEEQILIYQNLTKAHNANLVAVSKTKPNSSIETAYSTGQRIFGENKVQELVNKSQTLPKDIQWHMIGHLQSNKVKHIAPFITLIHAVDSIKLLKEINKQAKKNNRVIKCLLQIHISNDDSKFGFSYSEIENIFESDILKEFEHILITGVMGMATNTSDEKIISEEFSTLQKFFLKHKNTKVPNIKLQDISMGMSNDYQIALEYGATLIRIGSAIFGNRPTTNL